MAETTPVTIADVAALAGVPVGTVSKALNGRDLTGSEQGVQRRPCRVVIRESSGAHATL